MGGQARYCVTVMQIRQTHTYATLELSQAAFDEIATKLREAQYDHAFGVDDGRPTIDMQGIAVQPPDPRQAKASAAE